MANMTVHRLHTPRPVLVLLRAPQLDAEQEKQQGNAAFEAGDFEDALRRYNSAIKLAPDNFILFSNRSAAFFRLAQYDAALRDAETAVTLSEGSFQKAFLRRADANYALGAYEAAFEDYKHILQVDTASQHSQDGLARILSHWFDDRIRLCGASKVAVRYKDANIGKGLFATKDIDAGEIIMRERPLSCIQWTRSRSHTICCARCLRFTGPLSYQASFLLQVDMNMELPISSGFDTELPVFCPDCETFPYCSTKCKQLAWNEHHRILCPKTNSRALSFYQHAQTEGIDRFLLAGQIVSNLVLKIDSGSTFAEAWRPYSQLVNCSWTDVLSNRAEEGSNAVHQIRASMSVSLNLLIRAIQEALPKLDLKGPEVSKVLRIDFYSKLLGAFELNNPRVEKLSPLYKYFLFLAERAPGLIAQHEILQKLFEAIKRQFGGVPPSCEGEGVFPLHSTMNHSCDPCAKQVLSPDGNPQAEVVIVATKPIREGDEITISYINLDDQELDSTAKRREKLQADYLFQCNCQKFCSES